MAIHRRHFGRTGWDVSEVSFGAWQLGGQWGPVDDDASVDVLLHAFDQGIDFVDTAQMYGSGHSEEVVGRALRQWTGGHRVRVATKVQPIQWPHPSVDDPDIGQAYPQSYLRAQADQSRRRLGVDRIDLLQLHCWMPGGMRDQRWLDCLRELQADGVVDRIGVSLRDYRADEGVELARSGLVDSIQVIYNIFEQRPERELMAAAAETGTAIIVRVALDSGSLSGTWTPRTFDAWADDSVLRTFFREDRFAQTLERVAQIKKATSSSYDELDEVAIRFVLDRPEVSTVIVGMESPARVDRNVSFADGRGLVDGLHERLTEFEWERNFYV